MDSHQNKKSAFRAEPLTARMPRPTLALIGFSDSCALGRHSSEQFLTSFCSQQNQNKKGRTNPVNGVCADVYGNLFNLILWPYKVCINQRKLFYPLITAAQPSINEMIAFRIMNSSPTTIAQVALCRKSNDEETKQQITLTPQASQNVLPCLPDKTEKFLKLRKRADGTNARNNPTIASSEDGFFLSGSFGSFGFNSLLTNFFIHFALQSAKPE
jgi:hypothetical protein